MLQVCRPRPPIDTADEGAVTIASATTPATDLSIPGFSWAASDTLVSNSLAHLATPTPRHTANRAITASTNIARRHLTPGERAMHLGRRKELHEAQHPETRRGENQHTRVRQVGDSSAVTKRFTATTKQSERL